ncbi:response regulator [Halobiforma nitratireducens]|uniref:Putative response regulator n=1 Tax=Halobiforma nitratireducens JCM 10879 TaxID=1227454 RepID=M0LWH3_9EURY|nr:response regulator [Halobiforma nitratireducens]EMA37821.1 putative response regulator [Halobiforma nitratireducens JCM 10879]
MRNSSARTRADDTGTHDAVEDVVYVEDSDDDATMIETVVSQTRCVADLTRVDRAADALALLEAVEAGDRRRPTLLLVDVNLPDGSGFDVVERARDTHPRSVLPIAVVTGSASPDDVRTAYAAGANVYVVKPLSFVEFRQRLAGLCRFVAATEPTDESA